LFKDAVASRCQPPMTEWQPDSCGTYFWVPGGKHLLRAVSRIIGLDREFVAELEVDTSCDQVLNIDPSPPADAGLSGASLTSNTAACSVGGLGGTGPDPAQAGPVGLLLAAVGWVARRRARARP
jgi:hypothetical protein